MATAMWAYEGNAPHEAKIDIGNGCCASCGACMVDHYFVGDDEKIDAMEFMVGPYRITPYYRHDRISNGVTPGGINGYGVDPRVCAAIETLSCLAR